MVQYAGGNTFRIRKYTKCLIKCLIIFIIFYISSLFVFDNLKSKLLFSVFFTIFFIVFDRGIIVPSIRLVVRLFKNK